MWLLVVVADCVVLVAAACAVHAQERIKMCGRDLIRLAVSYCGNPRNRRSLPDADLDQHKTLWFSGLSVSPVSAQGATAPPARSSRLPAKKVSDICCEEGCSMKELIQFC
uniref:Insulin-like 3 n=1 Tax=Oryzias latipes TaxID=8090 RepID=A0A3B3HNE3_ORYLA